MNIKDYVNMPYKITIKLWEDERERYWVAEIPELPGCMSDGETIKEAIKNVMDAKELWIEIVLEDRGMNIPLPKYKTLIIENLGRYSEEEIQKCNESYEELKDFIRKFNEKHKDVVFLNVYKEEKFT